MRCNDRPCPIRRGAIAFRSISSCCDGDVGTLLLSTCAYQPEGSSGAVIEARRTREMPMSRLTHNDSSKNPFREFDRVRLSELGLQRTRGLRERVGIVVRVFGPGGVDVKFEDRKTPVRLHASYLVKAT